MTDELEKVWAWFDGESESGQVGDTLDQAVDRLIECVRTEDGLDELAEYCPIKIHWFYAKLVDKLDCVPGSKRILDYIEDETADDFYQRAGPESFERFSAGALQAARPMIEKLRETLAAFLPDYYEGDGDMSAALVSIVVKADGEHDWEFTHD